MTGRRSFLRSIGVAVMAVSMDVLPRFAAEPTFADTNARLVAAIDALVAVFEKPIPPAFPWTAREQALVFGEQAALSISRQLAAQE